jgi:ribose transport system permease protein
MSLVSNFAKVHKSIILSYAIAMLLLLLVSAIRPGFLEVSSLQNLAINAAVLGFVALGQTFVILIGGIDLSIPWTLTSTAMFLTLFAGEPGMNLSLLICALLAGSALIGVINGLAVSYLELSPVIVTLAMNSILAGALLAYTKGKPGSAAPQSIQFIAKGDLFGVPVILLIWMLFILLTLVLLSYSTLGRRIYAVGNSVNSAFFSGVNVHLIRIVIYGISGFGAGLAGIITTGRVGQAYLGMGDAYLFQSVAAVAVGGASIMGGKGHYIGTVAGAFILTILAGIIPAFRMPASAQQIIYGIVVLISVILARNTNLDR